MDSDSESKLISLISQLLPLYEIWDPEWESKMITLIIQIITLVGSMDLDSQPKPESKLMSLVTQTVSLFNSMDLDSLPEPLSKLISLISQAISADSDHKPESGLNLRSLALQLKPDQELVSLIRQIVSVVAISTNPDLKKLLSLCPQVQVDSFDGKFRVIGEVSWSWTTSGMWDCFIGNWDIFSFKGREGATYFYCESCKGEYHQEYEKAPLEIKHPLHLKHPIELVCNVANNRALECDCCDDLLLKVFYYCSACDFAINIACAEKPPTLSILPRRDLLALHSGNLSLSANTMDSDSESKLISLISQLPLHQIWDPEWESKMITLIIQIITLVGSMDLDSQPKPESKLMSLVTQTVSLFNSMDLDSLPEPLSKLISLISQAISADSDHKPESGLNLRSLVDKTLQLKPEPELVSLIRQIVSLVIYMNQKLKKLLSLCPQLQVDSFDGKFGLKPVVPQNNTIRKWSCFIGDWVKFGLTGRGEDATHFFFCGSCNGEYHQEYEKAPLKIKHPLHRRHYLDLVWDNERIYETSKCYCCGEDIMEVLYYCCACDFAMCVACVEKASPASHIDCLKWHEHTLALFPRRKASLICDVCALADSSSPFYICAPCDFVVHLTCVNLPRVIRICRHPHRISFTPSFGQGDWSCRICRTKIDSDYGGYSCIKEGCLYTAHSRCATQSNVWDGVDLEGVPEEIEEEIVEPFVKISDGIIRHFSHEHHHLRLDDNIDRDYDENKQCQACITPIYFGKFYSCVQCEFVLHETCAHLSRKLYHPIHRHPLTLALVVPIRDAIKLEHRCSTCGGLITAGFFYECGKEGCNFQLHVPCATISEPLVREIHMHPLYLTSKPGEMRRCCACALYTTEPFNCIECDGFSLCFECAAIPEKVRYKHDKHILTLSYEEETRTTTYWCEACETEINPKEGFYKCDEYCCVTLHIKCLIGMDLYMKHGTSFLIDDTQVCILPNNHHMSRPICSKCENRCPHKIVFQSDRLIFCSRACFKFFRFCTRMTNAIA